MKKHYIDLENNYLGVFIDGAEPDVAAVEVEAPPSQNHIYDGSGWVYDEVKHWQHIRNERDVLLSETDTAAALPDHPKRDAILVYRQALRDLPQNFSTPDEVVWPDNPLEA